MAFKPGFYAVRFNTGGDGGTGIVNLADGKLRGGDSMMAYVGDYQANGSTVSADLRAFKHSSVAGMESIFGIEDLRINLSGEANGDRFNLSGTSPDVPGVILQVSMSWLHD